jgi:hypothetical protein
MEKAPGLDGLFQGTNPGIRLLRCDYTPPLSGSHSLRVVSYRSKQLVVRSHTRYRLDLDVGHASQWAFAELQSFLRQD